MRSSHSCVDYHLTGLRRDARAGHGHRSWLTLKLAVIPVRVNGLDKNCRPGCALGDERNDGSRSVDSTCIMESFDPTSLPWAAADRERR